MTFSTIALFLILSLVVVESRFNMSCEETAKAYFYDENIQLEFPSVQVGQWSNSLQICKSTGISMGSIKCVEFGGWVFFDENSQNQSECTGLIEEKYVEGHIHYWEEEVTEIHYYDLDNNEIYLNNTNAVHTIQNYTKIDNNANPLLLDLNGISNFEQISLHEFNRLTNSVNLLIGSLANSSKSNGSNHSNATNLKLTAARKLVTDTLDMMVNGITLPPNSLHTISGSCIEIQVHNIDVKSKESHVAFALTNDSLTFKLPMDSVRELTSDLNQTMARVGFILYKNSVLFPSRDFASSQVISASITGVKPHKTLTNPVSFGYLSQEDAGNLTCGFWNFETEAWSTSGCNLTFQATPYSMCECNHLTNFAILVDIRQHDAKHHNKSTTITSHQHSSSPSAVIDYVSDVGNVLSIVGLTVTAIIHLSFRTLRRRRPQMILTHLCLSLLVAYILFMVGIEATKNFSLCAIFTVALHYFWLSAWFWMAVEGYTMYTMLVKVLLTSTQNHYITKACLFAYGIPGIIVSITAGYSLIHLDAESWEHSHREEIHQALYKLDAQAANQHFNMTGESRKSVSNEEEWKSSYVSMSACWLTGNPFYFGFLLPIGLIMLYNVVTFGFIIYSIGKRRKRVQSTAKKQTLLQQLNNLITMSILLGLSWCFGFLAMISESPLYVHIMHGFFSVCISFQGFIFFLLFCVRHRVVRLTWTKALRTKLPFLKNPVTEPGTLSRNYPCMNENQHRHHRTSARSNASVRSNALDVGGSIKRNGAEHNT